MTELFLNVLLAHFYIAYSEGGIEGASNLKSYPPWDYTDEYLAGDDAVIALLTRV